MLDVQVIFSDNSIIQCSDQQVQYVRRQPGEEMRDDCIIQHVKHQAQVMVWSLMSVFRTGRLYVVQGNMRQQQYKSVLEQCLLPQLHEWSQMKGFTGKGDFVVMHDGAPCHKG